MPAARWTAALIGALATACLFAAPAFADSCGNPGYSYAGVLSPKRITGVRAAISAPVAPLVESGDVSGWIGVGRAAVPGKRGVLRVGLLSTESGQTRLYYEVHRKSRWIRHLGPTVQPGEKHSVRVLRSPKHRKRWRVVIDRRVVASVWMSRVPRRFRAVATAESWDGGTPVCNRFRYSFGAVGVKSARRWHPLAARNVVEDPGYAVLREPTARFVATNAGDTPATGGAGDFRGDWETGDASQWTANQWNRSAPLSAQFEVESDVVREGRYAAKFTVRPGDKFLTTSGERSEVYWGGSDESEGDDYWYSWSTLFPTDWTAPAGWGYFIQWHADYNSTPPVLSLNARDDSVVASLNAGQLSDPCCGGATRLHWTVLNSLSKGRWNDFVAHIKWSGTNGAITLWHRVADQATYTKVLAVSGVPTLQSDQGVAASNYVKLGLYRNSDTKTSTLYQDGFRRWTATDPPPALAGAS